MVDTTSTMASVSSVSAASAVEAGAPEAVVTTEMLDAGEEVLSASLIVENPTPFDREVVRRIFLAMRQAEDGCGRL